MLEEGCRLHELGRARMREGRRWQTEAQIGGCAGTGYRLHSHIIRPRTRTIVIDKRFNCHVYNRLVAMLLRGMMMRSQPGRTE